MVQGNTQRAARNLSDLGSDTLKMGSIQVEDLLLIKSVGDIQIAPDGEFIAYTLTEIAAEQDEYLSNIWIVPAYGGNPRQFTHGPGQDTAPRWSPDGRWLAFLSDRAGKPAQLYLVSAHGGEARRLTSLQNGAGPAEWSPNGSHILFSARVLKESPPADDSARARWEKRPKVITRAQYKMDSRGYTFGERNQLFVVSVTTGEVRQLSDNQTDVLAPSWSPDGRRIAFSRMRSGVADMYVSDIWVMDGDGTNTRQLTTTVGRAISPSWSPDGRLIACLGTAEQELSWGDLETLVWLVPAGGGTPRCLTAEYDRPVQLLRWPLVTPSPVWSSDGTAVTFLLADAGNVQVVQANVADASVRPVVTGERQVTSFSLNSTTKQLAFSAADLNNPGDIFIHTGDGAKEQQLTNVNRSLLAQRVLPRVERRTFESPHGGMIDGWLMMPDTGATSAPLLLDIHGGPHSFVGNAFSTTYFYRYLLAARGWAVLMLNPAGSGSYGRTFAHSIRGRWGEYDMPEYIAVVETLIAEGVADSERLAVAGASYGGYMSAWIIGHTDRFKAAAIDAPVSNLESFYGTSDIGMWFGLWQMKGALINQRETYRRLSPINYVEHVTTPTLILHGENDDRCPIGQGEELFVGLVAAGRAPVEFVRYPEGYHGFIVSGRPSHRIDFHRRVSAWIERYTERRQDHKP